MQFRLGALRMGVRALLGPVPRLSVVPALAGRPCRGDFAGVADADLRRLAHLAVAASPSAKLVVGSGGGEAIDPDLVETVRAAQDGSAYAFSQLYDRYIDKVYAYVHGRVGHRQTAEDLTGDVFVNALRRIGSFRWQGKDFGAWLLTIARNRCHDHFKSARFRLEHVVDAVDDRPATATPENPERALLDAELAATVRAALTQLSGEQGEVLYLRFMQQLDVAETALVMGKKDGAIRALQYRALKALARLVATGELVAA